MAGKSKTLSKKTVIAIITIIVLLFVAGLSVGIFLADKGQTEAVDGNETEQIDPSNQDESNNEQNGEMNSDDSSTNPDSEEGNNDNQIPDEDGENIGETNNNIVTDNQGTNTGVTTDTNVNEVGEVTIERIEEQEKLVSEDFWDWWTPINVAVESTTANINAVNPELIVRKDAITESGNNIVYAGEEIDYTITVENKGNIDVENIEITDKIPQNTTFTFIDDAGKTVEVDGNVIGVKWIVTVPAGQSIKVHFAVKVNETILDENKEEVQLEGTILNKAIANGEESNETHTAIITTNKSSIVTRNEEIVNTAKLGDKITYTITVKNTGDIKGETLIEDAIPEGTKLVSAEGLDVEEEQTSVIWGKVELEPGEETTRSFVVEIVSIEGSIKNIATVGGKDTNEDEIETANIEVEKVVEDIKRNGESIGKTAEVKEGDVIEYNITVRNTGSKDLTNVVVDEKLEGIQLDAEALQIGDLAAGESVEIKATYVVTYNADIKDKEDREILNEVFVSGETVTDPENPDDKEKVEDKDEEKTPVTLEPRVKVEKSSEQSTGMKAGETVYYTIKVANIGNVVLENIAVSDKLTGTDKNGNTVEVTLPIYEDKECTQVITEIAKLEVTGDNSVKTVYAKYVVTQDDIDNQIQYNNIATSMDTPSNPVPTTPEELEPDVTVEKTATAVNGKEITDTTKVRPGDIIEYTITVDNTGNKTLTNIEITDELEVKYEGEVKPTKTVITTIDSLAPTDEPVEIKLYYTVTEKDCATLQVIANVATATAEDGTNDSDDDETVPVNVDTSVSVTKVWVDANNQDGKRPETITINLYADGKYVKSETISGTSYIFTKLPTYNAEGGVIVYTVSENEVKEYTTSYSQDTLTITNTHTPETTDIAISKVWDDANNQDGIRPESVSVTLYANGVAKQTITVTEANNWATSIEDLPVYANGTKIEYTLVETPVDGYETSIEGFVVTNSHAPAVKDVTVNKVWEDANNQDGIRPETVTLILKADGAEVDRITVDADDSWTHTFTNLPVNANGKEIVYTVDEAEVATGYEKILSGLTVTNSHTPAVKDVIVNKVWDDASNQDGIRPETVTLILKADGTEVARQTINAEQDNDWAYTFTNLPVNANGKEIVYTVDEAEVATGYEKSLSGLTVTNSHTPAVKDVTVNKVWEDASNQDGIRPETVTLILKANGTEVNRATVNAEANWIYTFTNLPVNANGKEIVYTVDEAEVATGYEKSLSGLTVTNKHIPAVKDVTVNKVWDDASNQDGIRPTSVNLTLYANKVEITTVAVSNATNWSYTFTNLPVNIDGTEIEYTVDEKEVATGYEKLSSGLTVTNSHTPAVKDVTVNKVWDDASNQDGIRPETVTLILKANGTEVARQIVNAEQDNDWTYTFKNLPVNANGKEIVYTVDEAEVATGYEKILSGLTVTNLHTPAVKDVTVNKVWDDASNQDGIRPETVTLILKANGTEVARQIVNAEQDNDWAYTFKNLPVNANGKEIVYTVDEAEVATGYEKILSGLTVTNLHTPAVKDVTVNKVWDDNNNQDGIRAKEISVSLKNGEKVVGTVILSATNNWTHTFTNLPVNEDGNVINYTVVEDTAVPGYEASIDGFTITNSHVTDTTSITVNKVWADSDNQDGIRPETITLILKSNGTEVARKAVTAAENWSHTFTNLPVNANGTPITYSVDEAETVEGYIKTLNGLTVTNTHIPAVKDVTVNKVWDDASNQDGIRPETITLILKANRTEVARQTVNAEQDNNWAYTFKNLPVNANGKEIVYTVDEAEVATGYEKSLSGLTVTNLHTPAVKDVTVNKVWDDASNQDGIRPETVTLILKADGAEVARQIVNAEQDNDWAYTFKNLPVNANGKEIVYTVDEAEVATGYEKALSGLTVTNSHIPAVKDVTVNKVWDDASNQDGIRPETVTLILKANGTEVARQTVNAEQDNDWAYTFKNLPVNANGKEIVYTVDEAEVATGYEKSLSGLTVTNSHVPAVKDVTVNKVWNDASNQDGIRPSTVKLTLYANNAEITTVTVSNATNWSYTFKNLPVNVDGTEIVYTVDEKEVATGYEKSSSGLTVTNKHIPAVKDVTVNKVWDDASNQDGIRPETVTLILKADGTEVARQTVNAEQDNDWAYTFKNLPVNANGKEIVYTVDEAEVATGYEKSLSGLTVTNKHIPAVKDVTVNKVWDDASNQDGIRPEAVTLILKANGTEVARQTVNAEQDNDWAYTFKNLPVNANGKEIVYTVDEAEVATGYEKALSGLTVTNKHNVEKTSVAVTKSWNDANNQDGIRPTSVSVTLKANGVAVEGKTVTLDTTNGWTYTFEDLNKKSAGVDIEYTVVENNVKTGYTATVTGNATDGYTITNRHEVEKTSVTVSKVWSDGDNQDGLRTDSVSVSLKAGSEVVDTQTLSSANSWTYTFANLDKKSAGTDIVYTVVENNVPSGYEAVITTDTSVTNGYGFIVTNSHTPEVISIPVIKVWEDNNNHYGARTTVTVDAKVGDTVKQTIELTSANSWSNSFTNLPKYNNGEEIVYTISERAVDGYITKSIVKDDATGAYTITNTYKNVTLNKMVLSSTETSTQQAKVDFVLVLDISGSMVDNKVSDGNGGQITRAKAMVNAANKAITTILSKNTGTTVNNRIGVVMFSGGVTTPLTLGDYDAKNTMTGDSTVGEFLKYSETVTNGWGGTQTSATITTNVTQKTQQVAVNVTGGTYTQLGIATGANMLANATDTTGRTPVMILLTDGKPTYGTTDYGTVTNTYNVGSGSELSGEIGEIGYLTVLSAVKYKNDINNHYKTATNQNVAQMYTIGIGMTGQFNTAVLNPNSTNVTACNNSSATGAQELYNYLTGVEATVKKNTRYNSWSGNLEYYEEMELPNPYANYSYANGSYTGEMDSTKLNQILQDIVNNIDIYTPQLVTTTTNINTDPAKVELVKLDTNKNIIIKLDNVANPEDGRTVTELITAGVLEHDTVNNKYYINLNDDYFASAKTIDITYYETKPVSNT